MNQVYHYAPFNTKSQERNLCILVQKKKRRVLPRLCYLAKYKDQMNINEQIRHSIS